MKQYKLRKPIDLEKVYRLKIWTARNCPKSLQKASANIQDTNAIHDLINWRGRNGKRLKTRPSNLGPFIDTVRRNAANRGLSIAAYLRETYSPFGDEDKTRKRVLIRIVRNYEKAKGLPYSFSHNKFTTDNEE